MMKKYYKFAGIELEISIPEQWMYQEERSLEPFKVNEEEIQNPHYFYFEIVDELTPPDEKNEKEIAVFPNYRVYVSKNLDGNTDKKNPIQTLIPQPPTRTRYIGSVQEGWNNAYIRAVHRGKNHHVQLKSSEFTSNIGVKTVLNSMEAEHLVVEAGGFILHASYIEWNGKAILFTAPSETGKSTQAELWRKHRDARIINGDRAVIRMVGGKAYAAGIPFAGSSVYCENATLPIAAIVYLKQAQTTTIQPMKGINAFQKIFEGVTVNNWNKEDLNKVIDLVGNVIRQVPVYELSCTPDESAIIALENILTPALTAGGNHDKQK